jgi:predicted permease
VAYSSQSAPRVSLQNDLRYSARSFARTPGITVALVLTIALGIGSNAAVQGFVRGLIVRDMPSLDIDGVVSVLGAEGEGAAGPLSYDEFLSIKARTDAFEWVGAARESQGAATVNGRSLILPVAAITPELASLFQLSSEGRVVISHRLRQSELGDRPDLRAETVRIDGAEARVAGMAPDWFDGLHLGRPVDIWIELHEASLSETDRRSRTVWVLGRLRAGVSIDRAETLINTGRQQAGMIRVAPYTGMTPDMAGGLSRIGVLLRAAAGAVFFIACANVASLLLSRGSARAHETSVRVALGARRAQLTRQLLCDSVLISVAGGAVGLLLAMWTTNIVPALFFDRDASAVVFAPDLTGIVVAATACVAITIACGLVPLFEVRDDRPAAVLQREGTGPSPLMRRVRMSLVVMQMALCCVLVIATGLLLASFRSALATSVGNRLSKPILATLSSRPAGSRYETTRAGLSFFERIEEAARSVAGVTPRAWAATLPGGLPAWQRVYVEPPEVSVRAAAMEVAPFTPATLSEVLTPPVAGRLFGGQDTPRACRVAIVNEEAERDVFGGEAVGTAIDDPAGLPVEIIGVVRTRRAEGASDPVRPKIYYYAAQTAIPLESPGSGQFKVPAPRRRTAAALDSNVVSAGYFAAMGWLPAGGRLFSDRPEAGGCRVAVVNEQAAELHFDGNAVGASVIDSAGRRTQIIGVVRATPLRTLQGRIEPAIYFPMVQDFLPGMTVILESQDASDAVLASLFRKLSAVPGRGRGEVVVRTLDSHLSKTALAPLRIATTLVGASAATALALGVLGLYGAMADAARQRRRELAVRIALGAQGWRVIRQVVSEGARLAVAGTVAGMLGSILVARSLAQVAPNGGAAPWVWVAAPLVLVGVVAVASVLPARRALTVDPLTITRS